MYHVVKIQSFSDIITNSSSELFCSAANTETLIKLIDSILRVSESEYKCEDLFEIDVFINNLSVHDYGFDEYYLDKAKEFRAVDKDLDELLSEYYKMDSYTPKIIEKIAEKLINCYDAKTLEILAEEKDISINYGYKIIAKDLRNQGDADRIQKLVNNLFEAQEIDYGY